MVRRLPIGHRSSRRHLGSLRSVSMPRNWLAPAPERSTGAESLTETGAIGSERARGSARLPADSEVSRAKPPASQSLRRSRLGSAGNRLRGRPRRIGPTPATARQLEARWRELGYEAACRRSLLPDSLALFDDEQPVHGGDRIILSLPVRPDDLESVDLTRLPQAEVNTEGALGKIASSR